MKKLVLTMIAIIALVSMLTAFEGGCIAEKGMHPYGEHPRMMHEEFGAGFEKRCEQLDLTEEQREQMHTLRIEHQKKQIELHSKMDILKIEKHEALRKHNFEQARKVTTQTTKLKGELALSRINLMEKHWNLLTDEQKAQITTIQKKHPRQKIKRKKEVMKIVE